MSNMGKTAYKYFVDEGLTIGINLGNFLDAIQNWDVVNNIANETAWGSPIPTQKYFNGLKNYGFSILRIPVTWLGHIGPAPDYPINKERLQRVMEFVNMANIAGLKVSINVHHDCNPDYKGWLSLKKAVSSIPDKKIITEMFQKIWLQIANYFNECGDWLFFEGFDHVADGNYAYPCIDPDREFDIVNEWNQVFSDTVRSTGGNNQGRYLVFHPYGTRPEQLISDRFILPQDPVGGSGKQIASFQNHEPWLFSVGISHEWNREGDVIGSMAFYDNIFKSVKERFINNQIPVIIAQSGPFRYAYNKKNQWYSEDKVGLAKQNRLEYISYVFGKARENGIVTNYWDIGEYNPEYATEGDPSLIDRITGEINSDESAQVIECMMAATKS